MSKVKDFVRDYALTCYTFEGIKEDYFIVRLIYKYVQGKRVLDLGCGPVVSVTSIFYPEAKEVVAVDRLQANLDFVRNNVNELRGILEKAVRYRRRFLSKKLIKPKIKLVKGDIAKKLNIGKFDSVMALGCFGALKTVDQYQKAVDNAYAYLKPRGTFFILSWIGLVKRPYKFNGQVKDEEILIPCLKKAGFKIKEFHKTKSVISEDTKSLGYNQIMWAVAQKL